MLYQARTIYATVADIDEALERIDAGTYGLCVLAAPRFRTCACEIVPWWRSASRAARSRGKSKAGALTRGSTVFEK